MKETQSRYKYYLRNMTKSVEPRNRFTEVTTFSKNFMIAFLKKLSPVIRIIYSAAIFLFIFSLVVVHWNAAILSFMIINAILIFEVADMLTVKDELEVARHVQTSLIPEQPPDDNNFEISFHYETAREVGGDFIDFISKEGSSYYISIGDISGKGMSAALYMVQVRLLMRHLTDFSDNPKEILSSVNKNLFKHVKKGLYLSAVLAEVSDTKLRICRAGHTPLIYYNSASRTCCEIKQNGMALGLSNGNLFENSLEEFEIMTNKDDIILFYSDGLTETMNITRHEFGVNKVKEILVECSHKSAEEIKNSILADVASFRGYAEVNDDMTMIILKRK